ncbi:MAG: hypothetical protein RLZZ143_2864 [Cyanobacteriota bacterium]
MSTTFKAVPVNIPRPEYVGKKAPNPYKGSDVQNSEVIEKMRIAGTIAADAMHLAGSQIKDGMTTEDLDAIAAAATAYQKIPLTRSDIEKHIPEIITFTQEAMNRTNHYLWGGTLAPNYDCSGLIQAAFATFGIWLPRDSYQQEAFCQKINREELLLGDLIFFGDKRVNHVALYLGNNQYIHSSGKETGNNGIAINLLTDDRDSVSRYYYQKLWSFGRVMHN